MISLRLYDRNGTTLLGLLAEPSSFQIGSEFNDVGAISFEYPADGVNASQIAELREVAVVNAAGNEVVNGRFVITGINRDRVQTTGNIQVTGKSILFRLDTALAYPNGGIASGGVSRFFDTATAGAVLKTLIDAAQTRGALSGLTYTFTNTTDSNSAAWPDTVTQEFPARTTILSVLRGLQEFGIVEVQTEARVLKATKTDGIGVDRTVGASPIILRYGQNLTEAPEQVNADRLATVALVEGDQGLLVERINSTGTSTYGRIETAITAAGIDDTAVVNSLGDAFLSTASSADRQLTVGLSLTPGSPIPFTDFNVGDYVYTATTGGLERVRVRQLTLSMSNGVFSASATLGDRIYENEVRTARKVSAITSGSVNLGNGSLPTITPTLEPDSIAPNAPTSVTGTSTSYLDNNRARARMALTWTAPTTNTDGSPCDDLRFYEIEYRQQVGDPFIYAGQSSSAAFTIFDLALGTQYRFRVYAVDSSGNRSAASTAFVGTTVNYLELPSQPSAPVLSTRLGTITVNWDGLTSGGAAMDIDLDFVEVHVSTTSGFNPSAATLRGRIGPGKDFLVLSDLAYGTTYFVRFMARNTSGVNSAASAQASASVQRLVNTDIIDASLSGAKFANGTIDTAQLADGSVQASKILNGAVGGNKIAADAITADKIAAGAIGADEIAANAIVAGKIAANAVTAGTVAALAISAGNIQSNAITTDKIDAGAITAVKIATNAITADKIEAGAITAAKIAAGTITTDKLVAGTLSGFTFQSVNAAFQITSVGNITGANSIGCNSVTATATISALTLSATGTVAAATVSATGDISGRDVTATRDLLTPNHTTVTDAANGRVTVTNGRVTRSTASSQRYKENITPLRDIDELDPKRLLQLPVRAFTYREDYLSETDSRFGALIPGFIAEEVDAVYPVAADYEDGQVESWNDRMVIPGLLALVQDLYKQVEELKGKA